MIKRQKYFGYSGATEMQLHNCASCTVLNIAEATVVFPAIFLRSTVG